jgi:hypothetical protein
MFYKMVNSRFVKEALKRTWESDMTSDLPPVRSAADRSCEISMLIFEIFGGKILKTRYRGGWHFYNQINGKRIDFTKAETGKSFRLKRFEDIPSSPDDTYNYFEKEDYSTFFVRFIRAFEETVGLGKCRPLVS